MARRPSMALGGAVALVLVLTGCQAPATTSSAPTAVVTASPTLSPSGSAFAGLAVPVSLDPPAGMPIEIQDPHLLTWRVKENHDDKIRIMVPIAVQPDGATPTPAPADYHAYLTGLVPKGAVITDDSTATIGGLPAHRFTITSKRAIDSGTGCWSEADDGCFGLPPELTLHMATIAVNGHAVVLWARTLTAHPNATVIAAFERMLPTVRFD